MRSGLAPLKGSVTASVKAVAGALSRKQSSGENAGLQQPRPSQPAGAAKARGSLAAAADPEEPAGVAIARAAALAAAAIAAAAIAFPPPLTTTTFAAARAAAFAAATLAAKAARIPALAASAADTAAHVQLPLLEVLLHC